MSSREQLSNARAVQITVTVGLGAAALFVLLRWLRRRNGEETEVSPRLAVRGDHLLTASTRVSNSTAAASAAPSTALLPPPPSSGHRSGRVRHATFSSAVPPLEADLVAGLETCLELTRCLERAQANLELVRNRSEKDRGRAEMVVSVLDRLRVLATDVNRLVAEGGLERDGEGDGSSGNWAGYQSPRAGTLSVLSDDSFMSAFEDLPPVAEDYYGRDNHEVDVAKLNFFHLGLEKASAGEVHYRKPRTEVCQCESETEFAAKLFCLRQAFEVVLRDEHRRLWLAKSGRQLLAGILTHSKQDPAQFYTAYDDLMTFLDDEQNLDVLEGELSARGVCCVSFWDVVIDFILLDAFDDMKAPPSAIYSVTKNFFLSHQMKYSTISTIIWSMLKAKRQRLKNPSGFIARFYNISEAVSPAITLGFLGTDETVFELCRYFKEQIAMFIVDVFSVRRVRYTSLQDLAEDVWVQMETRTENVLTRLSSELLPV